MAAATEKKDPEPLTRWAKENVEAIVVAFIMALVIRCFCIEVFKIPTSSMEPYLLGELNENHLNNCRDVGFLHYHDKRRGGDRIMVTKYFYSLAPIRRFDVAVFRFPLNQPRNFIKRIVGLPDETFFLDGGNIYFHKNDAEDDRFRIARKPFSTQQSIWIDVVDQHDLLSDLDIFETYWDADRAGYRFHDGWLTTTDRATFYFQPRVSDHGRGEAHEVGELRLALDLKLHGGASGSFFIQFVNEFGRLRCTFPPSKAGEMLFEDKTYPLPALDPDREYRVELMIYDGIAQVIVDGEIVGKHEFITFHHQLLLRDNDPSIRFGTTGLPISISNLTLGRDIYHKEKRDTPSHAYSRERHHPRLRMTRDKPIPIPSRSYVMMGDNVGSSHDSRAWWKHTWTLRDGTTITSECQEIQNDADPEWRSIRADQHGTPRRFLEADIVSHHGEPFYHIEEEFIIGKAFWVWWPPGRWFKLIR